MPSTTNDSDFLKRLNDYKETLNQEIEKFFETKMACFDLKLNEHEQESFDLLKDFSTRPGKRFRGALTLFAYDHYSDRPSNTSIYAGIAVELIQNYLLIIDDVMDQSLTRRGKPTVHQLAANNGRGLNKHNSEMLAINVGLLAIHMANDALCMVKEDSDNVVKALAILNRNVGATVYGQIDDLYNTLIHSDESQIMRVHQLKNSYYTFINPLQIGATLAGKGNKKVLDELAEIGKPAGIAFQLQDDLLGMYGDEAVTGKPAADDLREGKFTLLILYALENLSDDNKEKVLSALGKSDLDLADIEKVRDMIEKCGARQRVEAKISDCSVEAVKHINNANSLNSDAKKFLLDALDYVTNRKF